MLTFLVYNSSGVVDFKHNRRYVLYIILNQRLQETWITKITKFEINLILCINNHNDFNVIMT